MDVRKIEGHLDQASDGRATGWARLPDRPDARLMIEILVNGVVRNTVTADKWRADLEAAGIGDGAYGFTVELDHGDLHEGRNEVRARIVDTHEELVGSPVQAEAGEIAKAPIEYFAGDIVDNCNLRCPFCLVDYTNVRTTNRMTEETFRKWIDIMPLVQDGSFFISCLHEPTLHPRLIDFVEMIPDHLRRKIFFTTNLCKPMKDDQLERLANSGIHHINVSMDTLDPDLFGVLRKGGRAHIFMNNLERFVAACKGSNRAPTLRYITMAYKTNIDEVPGMVRRAFEEFNAERHEVRYTFNVRHITEEFRQEHFLSREDWVRLKDELDAMPYDIDIVLPPDDYEKAHARSVNYWEMPDEEGFPAIEPDRPIALRAAWDGEIRLRKREQHFMVNVNILRDPKAFFAAL